MQTSKYTTVTVLRSKPLHRPDGRSAILLETQEIGPIAFEVDQKAIDALRKAIASAETHIHRSQASGRH